MKELEKKRLFTKLKIKWMVESSRRDNEIIKSVEEDLSLIYTLEPRFIVKRYSRLFRVILHANCSESERTKMMNFIGSAYGKVREEERRERKNGYEL